MVIYELPTGNESFQTAFYSNYRSCEPLSTLEFALDDLEKFFVSQRERFHLYPVVTESESSSSYVSNVKISASIIAVFCVWFDLVKLAIRCI